MPAQRIFIPAAVTKISETELPDTRQLMSDCSPSPFVFAWLETSQRLSRCAWGALSCQWKTVTAKQARDLKWEVSLAHGCLWNTAALTGVLKGSHRKFPRQAPKSWEITRAKGSCLKKNPIHCKAHLFYENKSTRVSKSSRNKIRWSKAQQLSFQNVAFKLLLYSLMHCYSQDWLQYNDLWLQKAACAWGLGLYLGTKSKVLTVK